MKELDFVGIPVRDPAAVTREAHERLHRRGVIPQQTLDLMADILFDKRDVDPVARDEPHTIPDGYVSPMQRAVAKGELPRDEIEMVRARAATLDELTSFNRSTFRMDETLFELARETADAARSAKPVFYSSLAVHATLREVCITRPRRKKRRARYNRNKLGVRPRMRCGR